MRLRTKMVNDRGDWSPVSCGDSIIIRDLQHDATYAHALVQAISEIGVTKDGMYAECCIASDTQSFLRDRADELMREWGFGEVEDA